MASKLPVWAILPAAGVGRRMQGNIPKQYLRFQGKTIIEHCLDRLLSHPEIAGAIIILQEQDDQWQQLQYQAEKPVFTTEGGAQRQDSVYSGLTSLQYRSGNDVIALVHDAVRPLVTHHDLGAVIDAARQNPAGAILATPVADTLKLQNDRMEIAATHPREGLWRALTPQVFHLVSLLNALKKVIDDRQPVTDDAQAVELLGYTPALVAGSVQNLKITNPGDLVLAEKIWLDQRDQQNDE
jgi:2-C-methyl-D-erythritol 4-phosphate cytidylyltransferase